MRLSLLARASLLAVVALTAGCQSCARGSGATGGLDSGALGPVGGVDDVDFAPYLALAHALVTRAARPDVRPPPHVGQRVFVTYWSPGRSPVRATGLGPTLLDSVTLASEAVATTAAGDGRVEIDVVTRAEPTAIAPGMHESIFALGTNGYLAMDDAGHVGFVTPTEILTDKLAETKEKNGTLGLHVDKIRARLAERAGVAPDAVSGMTVASFGASEHIEAAKPGEPPIALVRSMPPRGPDVTADQLLASVRAATDYLARMVDTQGRFTYVYDPVIDASPRPKDYGILRHAGAIYAMMEAYEEMRVADWATAAERAVGYLVARVQTSPDGAFVRDNADEEQQKVGGGGLSLVGLTKYQEATGDTHNLETMRALARFIVHQQYPDGHLRDNADVEREEPPPANGKKLNKEVFYFVGEAMLGLVRLYALDPNPQWLASARRVADWVIDVRDAHDDLKHQIHDHWMSYALHDLYVITGEKRYADHAFKIAHAIDVGEPKPPAAPDYVGAFYDGAEVTPTSTRLEAVASAIQLARFMGQDDAWLRPMAVRYATFMHSEQLDDENDYFVKNPSRAIGGVRESLFNSDVRIDYDQHAASGWLRLARELRDPSWGKK